MYIFAQRIGRSPASCHVFILRAALCAWCLVGASAQAQFLSPAAEQKVRAATFEVVIPKPVNDNAVYEKPPPLDLLPYQFRTDKYYSIGTAFAFGPHRYVTAAHVLLAGAGSQFGTPALRDSAGRVYAIKQILKFSSAEDFVVFSLIDEPAAEPLEAGSRPAINDTVYAVGNALGEGVVIRDGLYTSDTPEERDGRWKWLRFTAAASPGNSGGPLLNTEAKVIGIVRAKSPNENLNYAVYIDQVTNARDNVALLDTKEQYRLDIFEKMQSGTLTKEFQLPKNFAEFSEAYLKIRNDFGDQLLVDLLRNNSATTFPHGQESVELLHTIQTGSFPKLIMKGEDGAWDVFKPQKVTNSDLSHNGYVAYGNIEHSTLLHLRRPDDVPAQQFYGDSQLYLDMVLKGVTVARKVATESIRVTSLGKARQDTVFLDPYGRKWQLRKWSLAYADSYLVSLALPVPDGYVAVVRIMSSAQVHGHVSDMLALSGFISVMYDGSLAQWRDFLSNTSLLPAVFSGISIEFDYGNSFRYKSARCSVSFDKELQPITASSELMLNLSFFNDHNKTVWDVAGIEVDESLQSSTGFYIARNMRPAESMNDGRKSLWGKIENKQHPLDAVAYNDGDKMYIQGTPANVSALVTEPQLIYSALYEVEGPASQDVMKAKLDRLTAGLDIIEN
jgi:serine protease Do